MVKDLFSIQATEYSRYRPRYPDDIYAFLNSTVSRHERAWDCATGNGQAALGLVPYFDEIVASDISDAQLEKAVQNSKIKYFKAQAENSGLESSSADLIIAATAIHLLNEDAFFSEAERILRPGGVIAAWNYTLTNITPEIDKIVNPFVTEILEDYWDNDILAFIKEQKRIELPFKKIIVPEFIMEHKWSFDDYVNFVFTWSATQVYIKKNRSNPIEMIYDELKKEWRGNGTVRNVRWKFYFKAAKKE